jgi:holo-[acyl-carrier protein] synthase
MTWSAVGVDLADPTRLAERLERRPGLAEELFTVAELSYCRSQYDSVQSLAGRFAAKEAVVKALKLDGWDPLEIEVLEGEPAPRVRLHGSAADVARRHSVNIEVSIAHLPTLAVAVALAVPSQHQPEPSFTALARLCGASRSAVRRVASVAGGWLPHLPRLPRR